MTLTHALDAAEAGFRIFPVLPGGKRPAIKNWPEQASTDPVQIQQWWQEFPDANYGIVTGPVNDLVVIDLDGKDAIEWWFAQGLPEGTMVRTPSGGAHIYYRTEDAEIQTNQSVLSQGVDVRGFNGYVVGPGSSTEKGTYRGDLTDVPDAPLELLEMIPHRQQFQHVQYSGEPVEAASDSEKQQIDYIIRTLRELPRPWHEGAGWRSTAYAMGCWLSRMVNSNAYALTEDQALTLLLTETPTDAEWGDAEILTQWESARRSTVGQFADPTERPNLLTLENAMDGATPLMVELVTTEPEVATEASLRDRRKQILVEAFRGGLSPEAAVTLVWNSRAARAMQADPAGLRKIWRDADRVQATVERERGAGTEAAPADERPSLEQFEVTPGHIDLLTKQERRLLADPDGRWFGDRYMDWVREIMPAANEPYHRMSVWLILGLCLAPYGALVKRDGIPRPLNIYAFRVGPTTSGKSESLRLQRSVLREFFGQEMPDIGGNASPDALLERLIMRDGSVSWFNKDEAHGQILKMKNSTYMNDMPQVLAELYDKEEIPVVLRATKKDISGVEARTKFFIDYMGTFEGVSDSIDPEDWASGFLNRFVWAISDKIERTEETMREDFVTEKPAVEDRDKTMQSQLAAELKAVGANIGLGNYMDVSGEVLERYNQLRMTLLRIAESHRHAERLIPTFSRLSFTILKAACLVALSEMSSKVSPRNLAIAVRQGEEWAGNILTMVEATDASPFVRSVNKLEQLVARQPGQQIRTEKMYRESPVSNKRGTDELVTQLVAQGRAEIIPQPDGGQVLCIKQQS